MPIFEIGGSLAGTFENGHTHTDPLLSAVAKKLGKPTPDGVRETEGRFIGEFYY